MNGPGRLVWINGPFGGGKTQTAYEIRRRLPGSAVCDPEHPGFGLHRMLPPELRGDFQELVSWRRGVVEVLDLTLTRRGGVVIAPMTVTDPGHFAETVGALRELGHDVRHVTLLAGRATVLRRLRERGVGRALRRATGRESGPRGESWAVRRLDHCLERLREPEFAEHLWTDRTTVPETADRVAALAGLRLRANTEGRLRTRVRQVGIGLRHVRLD